MSKRSITIDTPTYHCVTICDVCNQDIDQITESGVILSEDYHYKLTVQLSYLEDFDICSIACLKQWIEEFQKRKPGLK